MLPDGVFVRSAGRPLGVQNLRMHPGDQHFLVDMTCWIAPSFPAASMA